MEKVINMNSNLKKKRSIYRIKLVCMVILLLGITNVLTGFTTRFTVESHKKDEIKAAQQATQQKLISDYKTTIAKAKNDNLQAIQKAASFKVNPADLKNIDNVMIVAHPDDEALWGGEHLLKDNYLVVCMTNGNNKTRVKEFEETMKKTKDLGVILKYPDLVNNKRDNWATSKAKIINDIKYILSLKKWKTIVTHNPEGEYGHIHHKTLSMLVTDECIRENMEHELYYFGRYYRPKQLIKYNVKPTLTPQQANEKRNVIISDYTDRAAVKMFEHMIPYEKFIPYKDWTFSTY